MKKGFKLPIHRKVMSYVFHERSVISVPGVIMIRRILMVVAIHFMFSVTYGQIINAGPASFRKIQLNPQFYSEGINYADINKDGIQDVVSGPYYYPGPGYTQKIAFRLPNATPFDSTVDSYKDSDCYLVFIYDFNQDGWPDILSFQTAGGAVAIWYENPKGAAGYWTEHAAYSPVDDESPDFVDMDGDGKPELVTLSNGYGGWAAPNWASPNSPWTFHNVTQKGTWQVYTHALGTSDVNGDGRRDLILSTGWWEQPATPSSAAWVQHASAFWGQADPSESYGGAQMFAYDVDGDGKNDIVTSLQAHAWGLAWFQNQGTTFTQQMIMGTSAQVAQYGLSFSQLHAVALADVDGDGLKDIITGKRRGAHGNGLTSAELHAPAVLYWFKLIRQAGQQPHYQPYLIDSVAGVGTQLIVADINGDGSSDILTAGRHGAYVFLNQTASVGLTWKIPGKENGSLLLPLREKPGTDLLGRSFQFNATRCSFCGEQLKFIRQDP